MACVGRTVGAHTTSQAWRGERIDIGSAIDETIAALASAAVLLLQPAPHLASNLEMAALPFANRNSDVAFGLYGRDALR